MNPRYGHSFIHRAIALVSLAASIICSGGSAFAGTCTLQFPHIQTPCAQGGASATSTHELNTVSGTLKFFVSVDLTSGTAMAAAYGIDVNGNHLNTCATTAADRAPAPGSVSGTTDCSSIYGTPGTTSYFVFYDHPINMQSTFVAFA